MRGLTVEFVGRAGVGKTSLLNSVYAQLQSRGQRVAKSRPVFGSFTEGKWMRRLALFRAGRGIKQLGLTTSHPEYGALVSLLATSYLSPVRDQGDLLLLDQGPFHLAYYSLGNRLYDLELTSRLAREIMERSPVIPDVVVHVEAPDAIVLARRHDRGRDQRDNSCTIDSLASGSEWIRVMKEDMTMLAAKKRCTVINVESSDDVERVAELVTTGILNQFY